MGAQGQREAHVLHVVVDVNGFPIVESVEQRARMALQSAHRQDDPPGQNQRHASPCPGPCETPGRCRVWRRRCETLLEMWIQTIEKEFEAVVMRHVRMVEGKERPEGCRDDDADRDEGNDLARDEASAQLSQWVWMCRVVDSSAALRDMAEKSFMSRLEASRGAQKRPAKQRTTMASYKVLCQGKLTKRSLRNAASAIKQHVLSCVKFVLDTRRMSAGDGLECLSQRGHVDGGCLSWYTVTSGTVGKRVPVFGAQSPQMTHVSPAASLSAAIGDCVMAAQNMADGPVMIHASNTSKPASPEKKDTPNGSVAHLVMELSTLHTNEATGQLDERLTSAFVPPSGAFGANEEDEGHSSSSTVIHSRKRHHILVFAACPRSLCEGLNFFGCQQLGGASKHQLLGLGASASQDGENGIQQNARGVCSAWSDVLHNLLATMSCPVAGAPFQHYLLQDCGGVHAAYQLLQRAKTAGHLGGLAAFRYWAFLASSVGHAAYSANVQHAGAAGRSQRAVRQPTVDQMAAAGQPCSHVWIDLLDGMRSRTSETSGDYDAIFDTGCETAVCNGAPRCDVGEQLRSGLQHDVLPLAMVALGASRGGRERSGQAGSQRGPTNWTDVARVCPVRAVMLAHVAQNDASLVQERVLEYVGRSVMLEGGGRRLLRAVLWSCGGRLDGWMRPLPHTSGAGVKDLIRVCVDIVSFYVQRLASLRATPLTSPRMRQPRVTAPVAGCVQWICHPDRPCGRGCCRACQHAASMRCGTHDTTLVHHVSAGLCLKWQASTHWKGLFVGDYGEKQTFCTLLPFDVDGTLTPQALAFPSVAEWRQAMGGHPR